MNGWICSRHSCTRHFHQQDIQFAPRMASGFMNEDTEIQGGIMMVHSSKGPRPYTVVWTLSHLPLKKTNVLKSGLELRVFVSELSNVLRLAGTFLEPALSQPPVLFFPHVCLPLHSTRVQSHTWHLCPSGCVFSPSLNQSCQNEVKPTSPKEVPWLLFGLAAC